MLLGGKNKVSLSQLFQECCFKICFESLNIFLILPKRNTGLSISSHILYQLTSKQVIGSASHRVQC